MRKIALIIVGLCLSVGALAEPEKIGQWEVYREVSPMDDSKIVQISINSERGIHSTNRGEYQPSLAIICRGNKTEVYIGFGGLRFSSWGSARVVTFRIDSETAFDLDTTTSTDLKAFFVSTPIKFIKKLFGHDRLLVRARVMSGDQYTVPFNISGLEQAITEVRETCHW